MTTHPCNLQCFLDCYKLNLLIAKKLYPNDYRWLDSELDAVLERMNKAIEAVDQPSLRT